MKRSLRLLTFTVEQSTIVFDGKGLGDGPGLGLGDGPGLGLGSGDGSGVGEGADQVMPEKVELMKPEGFYPSILYIIVPPVEFLILTFLNFEYTIRV